MSCLSKIGESDVEENIEKNQLERKEKELSQSFCEVLSSASGEAEERKARFLC